MQLELNLSVCTECGLTNTFIIPVTKKFASGVYALEDTQSVL